jgi:sterol desaturase/sphingolipid hydroxylase (fatty acid hydroxylase superfamily)
MILNYLLIFLLWTFCLYWIHRIIHITPYVKQIHFDHHRVVLQTTPTWRWNNLFLFNDTWLSTVDLWITEVIPTILLSWITGHWWLIAFYYIWAAFIQEIIEHNPDVNIPVLASGRKHLVHHKNMHKNYGLFFLLWDRVFGTYQHE